MDSSHKAAVMATVAVSFSLVLIVLIACLTQIPPPTCSTGQVYVHHIGETEFQGCQPSDKVK